MANRWNKPERVRRAVIALLNCKASILKTGTLKGASQFFREQHIAAITTPCIHDIKERDITDEYALEVLKRYHDYQQSCLSHGGDEPADDEQPQELDGDGTPRVCDLTGDSGSFDDVAANLSPAGETRGEREIFDLDEQTCIDYLKTRGWHFAQCHIATKWV